MKRGLLGIALLVAMAACGDKDDGQAAAGLVTEADSMVCGTTAVLYNNHTANPKDLHVRVKNNCVEDTMDTMPPPPARLVVLDAQGRPVPGQDISIPSGTTHRGTMTVPANARMRLECSTGRARTGCSWFYQYALP
jgi:hypothetical protein